MDEFEPEKTPEWCCTCDHCIHDRWYPCELSCDNPYSDMYDKTVDKFDRCDWWKERQE